jgi:catechol 2,3-dioxygenase-like lactoylglutathione lyase family enzyme
MTEPLLTCIDHIVIAVEDLEKARQKYVALLGRSPSWTGSHPAFGTRNVLFRLENTYIELLAPEDDGPIASILRAHLAVEGEGLFAVALGTEDIDRAVGVLRKHGFAVAGPTNGLTQDGPSGAFRRFRNVFIPPDETRGVRLFVIQHLSEKDELPPSLPIADEAAAVGALDHVVILTRDPEHAKTLYGDVLGLRLALDKTFEKRGVRLLFFRSGGATLEIGASLKESDEEGAASSESDRLWGLALQVADVDRAHERMQAAGLDVTSVRDGHKPGTRVLSVKNDPLGVPTLIIQPVAPSSS